MYLIVTFKCWWPVLPKSCTHWVNYFEKYRITKGKSTWNTFFSNSFYDTGWTQNSFKVRTWGYIKIRGLLKRVAKYSWMHFILSIRESSYMLLLLAYDYLFISPKIAKAFPRRYKYDLVPYTTVCTFFAFFVYE